MRILHISNNYTPYSGGVVSSLNVTIPYLRAQGWITKLVTLDFQGIPQKDPEWVQRLYCPVKIRYQRRPLAYPWRPYKQLERIIQTFYPHIVHVHHPFFLGAVGEKVAWWYHIPVVFTYHTWYHAYSHYIPLPNQITVPLINYRVRSFCKRAAHIIAPSNAVKNHIASSGIDTPTTVIPSAIQNHFISDWANPRKASSTFKLIVVGRFALEKNLPVLLEMLLLLPEHITLTFVGYGDQYYTLARLAYRTYKFTEQRVMFVLQPEREALIKLYKQADLFVFTSVSDTQALVLAEAMAAGCPVVALDGPGQQDIVINGYNGYLVKTIREMSECIAMIDRDRMLHQQLCTNAWQKGCQYHINEVGVKLLRCYEDIASKSTISR